MYSDAHTHLTGPVFGNPLQPQEVQGVLQQARDKGIAYIVASGHDLLTSEETARIAAAEDIVYASIGLHPWIAAPIDEETYRGFLALAKQPKVVAVGEIGLDENRSRASKEAQLQAFTDQLLLAQETGLGVFLHERGYRKEMLEVLDQHSPPCAAIHGFRDDKVALKGWLDLGFYVTIGRTVLEADGERLKPVVQQIPEDRLLFETDGVTRSEEGVLEGQARVVQVAQVVARWRGTTGEEVGEVTTKNLRRMLGI